ncbi:putative transcriptional regulatory protein C3C7.04 [Fusarium oxysporum f. sp. albedinis]|nr:putative transcriptional regulatory protein C3C7.04 [Fusarium oxysporum f. sp. albedinis]
MYEVLPLLSLFCPCGDSDPFCFFSMRTCFGFKTISSHDECTELTTKPEMCFAWGCTMYQTNRERFRSATSIYTLRLTARHILLFRLMIAARPPR